MFTRKLFPCSSYLLMGLTLFCCSVSWAAITENVLYPDESLYLEDYIESSNGRYRLYMRNDGNVVVYGDRNDVIFQSNSAGSAGAYLTMQADGNLVAHGSDGSAIFTTGTHGNPGAYATLEDSGSLVVYAANGTTPLWTSTRPACLSQQGNALSRGITPHFHRWLNDNGYGAYDLDRSDLSGGSFGGKVSESDCALEQPVIFVHGNSDRCIGGLINGWEKSAEYFQSKGYRSSELYCTSYGTGSAVSAASYYHSQEFIMRIRKMVEAVKAYTGADKVDIIGHSMGVTLARKAIKGGWANDLLAGGVYYIGPSLTSSVDTFVGIAGGNRGLASCYFTGPSTPGCGASNGFYPGYMFWGMVFGVSDFLEELNNSSRFEGRYRYSIWSTVDEVVGGACLVWGRNTCRIPGQTSEKKFYSFPYGHIGVRDQTGYYQYRMVHDHATN
ncbi:MAG: hypothetical protein K6L80_05075 [Agarilytica sp.]